MNDLDECKFIKEDPTKFFNDTFWQKIIFGEFQILKVPLGASMNGKRVWNAIRNHDELGPTNMKIIKQLVMEHYAYYPPSCIIMA